jgi:hypothetical protein
MKATFSVRKLLPARTLGPAWMGYRGASAATLKRRPAYPACQRVALLLRILPQRAACLSRAPVTIWGKSGYF